MSEAESEQRQIGNEQEPERGRIEKKSLLFVCIWPKAIGHYDRHLDSSGFIFHQYYPSSLFCHHWYVYHSVLDKLQPPFFGHFLAVILHSLLIFFSGALHSSQFCYKSRLQAPGSTGSRKQHWVSRSSRSREQNRVEIERRPAYLALILLVLPWSTRRGIFWLWNPVTWAFISSRLIHLLL